MNITELSYWFWNRRKYFKKFIIWFLSIGISALIGVYISKQYTDSVDKIPVVKLFQGEPYPSTYFKNYIDFPYFLTNESNSRAHNIKLKIIATAGTKASRSPLLEFSKDNVDLNDSRNISIYEYTCNSLDPKETAVIYLSVIKEKFEKHNNLPPLNIGDKFSVKNIHFPSIVYLKHDKGKGKIELNDSLTYLMDERSTAKENYKNSLENGNKNLKKLRIDYTIELFQEIIRDTDRVFSELKRIKKVLDNARGEFDWNNINKYYDLPDLLFYKTLKNDTLINKNNLPYFDDFTNFSIEYLSLQKQKWSNENLSKDEAYNRIKYYNNEVVLIRKTLVVMLSKLENKTSDEVYINALGRYESMRVKSDSLPLIKIGEINYFE